MENILLATIISNFGGDQMKKFLLVPDSFKGTMSSLEICEIMQKAINNHYPDAQCVSIPVADGGEGSVEAFLTALGGRKVSAGVSGPFGEQIDSFFGLLPDGTAVIEMAAAAGLPLAGENKNAEKTTTYGVGQLIKLALSSGCKKIIIGLGGSATNDGGCGAASAMGVRFFDNNGRIFVPTGKTLRDIAKIELADALNQFKNVELIAMCDIDNPLCGPNGASAVFGPQKGADGDMVKRLDNGLLHLSQIVKRDLGKDIADMPGAGAAGGMGFGVAAFFDSRLQMGIETVLDAVKFDKLLKDADMVLTGEGKMDTQSLRGKVVIGVARRAKKANVPVVAIVGDIGDNIDGAYAEGVSAVFSINRIAAPFSQAKLRCKEDLYLTVDNFAGYTKLIEKINNR